MGKVMGHADLSSFRRATDLGKRKAMNSKHEKNLCHPRDPFFCYQLIQYMRLVLQKTFPL